jgi:hypothetical protein
MGGYAGRYASFLDLHGFDQGAQPCDCCIIILYNEGPGILSSGSGKRDALCFPGLRISLRRETRDCSSCEPLLEVIYSSVTVPFDQIYNFILCFGPDPFVGISSFCVSLASNFSAIDTDYILQVSKRKSAIVHTDDVQTQLFTLHNKVIEAETIVNMTFINVQGSHAELAQLDHCTLVKPTED